MVYIDKKDIDTDGKWPGIFQSFGINVGDGGHVACPICGPGENSHRFRFDNRMGKGTWICTQCKAGDGWQLLMKVLGIDFKEACEEVAKIVGTVKPSKSQPEPQASPENLRKLFLASKPIKRGDPVSKYLANRGLSDFPKTLRYCPKCWESDTKQDQQAMLAVFTLNNDEAVTIQRTYIKDGKKLDIESPKKTMAPLKKMTGGAVRLYEPDNGLVGVAEGIETAIGCKEQFKMPVWATLSAALLEGFLPPKGIKELVVFSDNDMNFCGQKAAYILANKAYKDIKVHEVQVPARAGEDWLDEITRINEQKENP